MSHSKEKRRLRKKIFIAAFITTLLISFNFAYAYRLPLNKKTDIKRQDPAVQGMGTLLLSYYYGIIT